MYNLHTNGKNIKLQNIYQSLQVQVTTRISAFHAHLCIISSHRNIVIGASVIPIPISYKLHGWRRKAIGSHTPEILWGI